MGKGFAYVNFQQSDGVLLALEMENVQLKNRELRISLCNNKLAKKNKRRNKIKNVWYILRKLMKLFNDLLTD